MVLVPAKRRKNDLVMENFTACTRITALELMGANKARLWLQVTCISDLADISGSRIPWDSLNREWRVDPCPDITWPQSTQPSKKHWTALQKCLRKTLCTTVNS
jgi:hypothetical protein